MKTSDTLLDYLVRYGPSRVVDLSAALDLTPADIRYQLKTLISCGLVQSVHPARALIRGRPAKRFEVTSIVQAENIFFLIDLFADQIISLFPKLSTEEVAGKMWKRFKKKLTLSSSPYKKITQILFFLDSIGVKTTWEAGKSGPEIKVTQNPYQTRLNPRTSFLLADSIVSLALQDALRD